MPLNPLLQDVRILADRMLEESEISWKLLKEVAMAGKTALTDKHSYFNSWTRECTRPSQR